MEDSFYVEPWGSDITVRSAVARRIKDVSVTASNGKMDAVVKGLGNPILSVLRYIDPHWGTKLIVVFSTRFLGILRINLFSEVWTTEHDKM